jgi:hypothetical protein
MSLSSAYGLETQANPSVAVQGGGETTNKPGILIEAIEPGDSRNDEAWLGVATEEAPEALAAQLELPAGSGLIVTFVAEQSPAARLGLQKNDVLVQFDDQALVLPAQLRKLVRVHNEGETVKLAFYHAGKRMTKSVTLAKAPAPTTWDHLRQMQGDVKGLHRDFQNMYTDQALREQAKELSQELRNLKLDETREAVQKAIRDIKLDKDVQAEIRGSLDEASKAVQEAMRSLTNAEIGPAIHKVLEDLARSGVSADTKPSVTVRSTEHGAKSLVQADESGTIVLVSNPRLHLTAHDRDGKLLFDGEVETADQRAKVPRELWEKVEPLLEKMGKPAADRPEASN